MTEPEKPSVKSYVAAKLEDWFGAEFDSNKIRQAEAPHDQFNPSEGALFHPLFRHEAAVPRIPGLEPAEPSLLMHNLGKDKATDEMAPSYKYIAETKQKGPGALYGTSGAGKTRSVLEYLSYNKGLYLAAETEYGFGPAEPGSGDLSYVFRREHLKYIHDVDGDREKIDQSNINLDLVQQRVSTLLYIRHAVHEYVVTKLGVELSALGWLMLQLYPKHYFGEDIFASILINCIMDADLCNLRETCDAAIREAKTNWKAIVIDESQVLLRRHTHHFCSSKDSKKARTGFAAILNSMLVVKITASRSGGVSIPFPLFAGTGMSIDEVDGEAKRLGVLEKRPYFTRFPTLDVEGVKSYMKRFLQLDVGVGEAVLDHIAKWLTGRPRWTATFLEEFFVRSLKPENLTTKGIFEDNEKLMIQALDRYIHDMTELDRRQSWTGSNDTARTAIQKAMTTINNREMLNDLELALYHFTFGGNTHLITKSTKYLIEIGVARLKLAGTEDPDGNTYKVTVDEPLIVEAGIRHVGLNTLAKWGLKVRYKSNGEGDSFEEIAVVALRSRLKEVLGTTFPDSNRLAKLSVPTKSSYGVMVKSCKWQGQ